MSPLTTLADISAAIADMVAQNEDDQTRDDQIKQNKAWIQYYRNKLIENENSEKRPERR